MRLLLFISVLSLIPLSVNAEDIDSQINKACLRHAVSLVGKLKAEVLGDLSQNQSDQALKIATESCQIYFRNEFGQNPDAIANNADDMSGKDWLTEKILNDDTSRKEGNKRLKRFK